MQIIQAAIKKNNLKNIKKYSQNMRVYIYCFLF